MSACTIFKNFTNPVQNLSLVLVSNQIVSGKYKEEVLEIRKLLEQGKTEEASEKKKQLLAFTPSGIFKEKRLMSHLERYTGFLHLDFDKLSTEQIQKAVEVITKIPYTFICFVSPSGNGLKVFMEVDSAMENHATAYLQVQKFYEEATGLKSDPACKDITRLCFMSYDPNLYKNLYYEKFHVVLPQTEIVQIREEPPAGINKYKKVKNSEEEDLSTTFIFQQQIQFTNSKSIYQNGNRNNYMYLLGSNCNRAGLSESDTIEHCIQNFDLSPTEIQKSVKSAYLHHAGEFAKFANIAKLQSLQNEEGPDIDYLKNTPTIPDNVFANLPDILNKGCSVFEDKRKRDVFFTGAIAILSGCLPNVSGIYDNERIYPHLYTFIIAPAASGKGVLKNAKRLADKYHQQIVEESREQQRKYKIELADYNNQKFQKKNEGQSAEKPEEPPFKVVFIPANCSQARIIEHLESNEGQGIICETEADTMSSTKKQDWGDYSTIMRQAFHHEKISLSRKTNNEFIEINEPRLAITLTGTPSQAPKLIASAEDGLFSRFLFYAYKNDIEWADPSPKEKTIVFNDHFDTLAEELLRGISFLSFSQTEINLSVEQWKELNTTFKEMLSDVTIYTSEDAASVVYRLGLITYRLCMIFTALRKIENAEHTKDMICMQQDFDSIMQIVKTYLQHNILMFNNLPKQNDKIQFQANDQKKTFFDALPREFTRKDALELSKSFKMGTRTVDEILRMATGKSLNKIKSGLYQKI